MKMILVSCNIADEEVILEDIETLSAQELKETIDLIIENVFNTLGTGIYENLDLRMKRGSVTLEEVKNLVDNDDIIIIAEEDDSDYCIYLTSSTIEELNDRLTYLYMPHI